MSEEKAHSLLGASSAKRWIECPGSVKLSEGVENTSSKYADEGTAAHELAERCLKEQVNAVKYLGEHITVGENVFEVTAEMADAVQIYIETVRSYCNGAYELMVEQRFHLDWIDDELFGTNDACVVQLFDKVVIIDFKYGRGVPVEAIGNKQLLYYALGGARGYEGYDVELVIVQPRCPHPEGPVRKWNINYHTLTEYEQELRDAVVEVNKARKLKDVYQLTKSGDHCKFCPAKGFCKTLRHDSLSVANVDFDDWVEPTTLPTPQSLTPDQISRAIVLSDLVEEWISAVRNYAHEQLVKGVEIPGFKLVQKRANRAWKDEDEVIKEFEDVLGDLIFTKKLKSPAQLEKILGKEVIKKHSCIPDNGTAIAPLSDKRPAIKPTILEFDSITD